MNPENTVLSAGSGFELAVDGVRRVGPEYRTPSIERVMPRVMRHAAWLIALTFAALAAGFIRLYRASSLGPETDQQSVE